MKPKIVVLVGMIASGKSTYARNAAKAGYVVINDDAIVTMLHGGDYSLYDVRLKPLYKSVENHIAATAIAMGRSVVVDRGVNIGPPSRKRWLGLATALDVLCVAVEFPRGMAYAHAERRFQSDGRGSTFAYWLKVAESHEGRYGAPSVKEGFGAIHYPSHVDVMGGKVF